MSQVIKNLAAGPVPPAVATSYVTNSGTAIPVANVLNVFGALVPADSIPVRTIGSGNTVTVDVQTSQAIAATDSTKIGLAAFNSSEFTVDANGFVSLLGGGSSIQSVNVDAFTAPGTNPVVPTLGAITVTGGQVAAGTTSNVIRTDSLAANTYTIQIQRSQSVGVSTIGANGVSHFNSSQFSVDTNGFVSLVAAGFTWIDVTTATQTLAVQTGYVTDHVNVTYTLPATATFGQEIRIVGKLGITTISQNAGQQILMGSASSTAGVTGSVVGTNVGDCIDLICITAGASTVWRAANWVGNWTVN